MTALTIDIVVTYMRNNEADRFLADVEVSLPTVSPSDPFLHYSLRNKDVTCNLLPLTHSWGSTSICCRYRVASFPIQHEDLRELEILVINHIDKTYQDLKNLINYNRDQENKLPKTPRVSTFVL